MLNRVVVTIDGVNYTVVAEEDEEYIRKTAALVDKTLADIKAQTTFSTKEAAVLSALNIADKYYKAIDASDNLRRQIKEYANENAALRAEKNRAGR